MNAVTWAALGAALLLVPLGDPLAERLRALALRGRLHLPRSHAGRGRRAAAPVLSAPLVGAGALVAVTIRAGPALGVAAGLAAATAVHLAAEALRHRAADRSDACLLAAVRVMAAEVAAGATAGAALGAAAEVDPSRAGTWRAAAAVDDGGGVATELGGSADLRAVAQAWSVAAATGAPIAAVLERVVADLVARREQARAVTGALAGPRSSALVLAALPVVGIGLGLAMDADPLAFLLGSPGGRLVCLVGVGFDVAGLFWTRRLAARAAVP